MLRRSWDLKINLSSNVLYGIKPYLILFDNKTNRNSLKKESAAAKKSRSKIYIGTL